jgi:16S rRNA (uracil1498-N3)-methyltransferase
MNTPKKLHRFFVETLPAPGATMTITDTRIVHQASRVLALQSGEEIALFANGSDDHIVTIAVIDRTQLIVRMIRTIPQLPAPRTALIAAIGIPKGDTFEFIVQKLTELGVSEIVPIRSQRTVKQSVRLDRLQTISHEALEQCGGNRPVIIHEPTDLADCIVRYPLPSIVYDIPRTEYRNDNVPTSQSESSIMYIGPEGGWSEDDLARFEAINATFATLGPRVLRTETAAIIGTYNLLWN